VIDAYLTELGKALRGPRRAKSDLLAEARDHLTDATEQYERDGLKRPAAERAATTEFGELAEIIPAYQAELGLAQGHRTALGVLFMSAAQPFVWGYAFSWVSGKSADQQNNADELVENLGGLTILLSLLAVFAYRFGMRHPKIRTKLVHITGIGALGACALLASGSVLLTAWTGGYLTLLWTVTFVLTPATWVATSASRCLRSGPQHTVD
jgi:hypothetical protein